MSTASDNRAAAY